MFIDIHAHAYRHPYPPDQAGDVWFSTPEQLFPRYKELQIDHAVLLPIVSPEVYLPQSNGEILEICKDYPDVFSPFCNIDPRVMTNSSDAPLGHLFEYYREQGCKGIGEVMPNMAFLDPKMQNLFKHAETAEFPLIIDLSGRDNISYGLYDDPGLPQLRQTLENFPKLKIFGHGPAFWAEISSLDKLEDRLGYPKYPIREEGTAIKLLREYPNMYAELSAGSGLNAMTRDPEFAVEFINEFQDKICYGTDICRYDQEVKIGDFLIELRDSGKISEKTFPKIARKNAIQILNLNWAKN